MAKPKRSHFKTQEDFVRATNAHYRKNARQGADYIESMNNFFDKQARRNATLAFAAYHDHKDRVEGRKVKNYDYGTVNVMLYVDKMTPSYKYPMSQMQLTCEYDYHGTVRERSTYLKNDTIGSLPIKGCGYVSVPALNASYLMAQA